MIDTEISKTLNSGTLKKAKYLKYKLKNYL